MATFAEESAEQVGAFVAQNPLDDFATPVEAFFGQEVHQRPGAPGFRVAGSENDAVHTGQNERAGAHRARFERYEELRVLDSPRRVKRRRSTQRERFRMRGRVAKAFAAVVFANENPILTNENGADRRFPLLGGDLRFDERGPHKELVAVAVFRRPTFERNVRQERRFRETVEGSGVEIVHWSGKVVAGSLN